MTAEPGLVVVGSGPAGLAAVRSFREREPAAPVIMLTEDDHPPYARPPLTKDFLRRDSTLDDLWLTEPGWFDEQRVEIQTGHVRGGPGHGSVGWFCWRTRSAVPYAEAVLATGSTPTPLPVPGGDAPGLVSRA